MSKTEIERVEAPIKEDPEEYVRVTLSLKEAALIRRLRKHDYGKFRIHKQAGVLTRIELEDSEYFKDSEGFALAVENNKFELRLIQQGKKIVDPLENVDNIKNGGLI